MRKGWPKSHLGYEGMLGYTSTTHAVKFLHKLQQSVIDTMYFIIDEMCMVGRKTLGQVDRHLRQIFHQHAKEVFGGCSCLLFSDFGLLAWIRVLNLVLGWSC